MDAAVQLDEKCSMTRLMSECVEFLEEGTLLQDSGSKMGGVIERRPKFRTKLAGEGIEYSWVLSKNVYHRLPISENQDDDTFLGNVRKCLSQEKITTDLICKFAKRSRRYIF